MRVTPSKEFLDGRYFCFNPRARAGRDMYVCITIRAGYVSIHAPARGATDEDG